MGAVAYALVRLLLEHYYDPLYAHGEKGRDHALRVDGTHPERAARAILDFVERNRSPSSSSSRAAVDEKKGSGETNGSPPVPASRRA